MTDTDDAPPFWRRLTPARVAVGAFAIVVGAWLLSWIGELLADVDLDAVDRPYLLVATFVTFDAVVPIFPSESLLNAGSVLATQDGSSIELWRLIVAGSVGAVIGDSLLYWLSRSLLRNFMTARLEQAEQNEQVAEALDVLRGEAPLLIVAGRFVPGVRFVVGATMGLTRYPFPRFLLWDAVGGVAWASFSCVSATVVATALGGQPVLSLAISALLTTALLGLLYQRLKASRMAATSTG